MADEAGSFLRRWARLKTEQSKPSPAPEPESISGVPDASAQAPEENPPAIDDLPPIDELTAESDFTAFLRAGVPEELKRQALRKLWRSDPVFANLDGLVEYGEDFGAAFRNPGPVATLFRIGRGMPGPEDLEEQPEAAAPEPEQVGAAVESDSASAKSDAAPEAPPAATNDDPSEGPNSAG
jgi:hypothetical protein